MNCDDVFDILTRGPFPTGATSDRAVERHLDDCEECCRLAEALRPAVELLQEAIAPEESRTLPSYWGTPVCSSEAVQHAFDYGDALTKVATASAARRPPRQLQRPRRATNVLRFAAMFGLGLILALAVHGMTSDQRTVAVAENGNPAATASATSTLASADHLEQVAVSDIFSGRLSAAGRSQLLALNLTSDCRPLSVAATPTELPLQTADIGANGATAAGRGQLVAQGHFQCCSNCHGGGKPKSLRQSAVSQLAHACLACHN